jgi:formylglycine-generating enzyme required for sulfatase activity
VIAASEHKRAPDHRAKIFISYSRKDMVFVDRLEPALKARGFAVLIDRRDLPDLVDWQRELLALIRRADTVVFIVSQHSVTSKVVGWELDQVRTQGKRLAPIVIANVENIPVPDDVARINYLFFTDEALFEERVDQLASALNTDVAWLKEHTRLSDLVRRWQERNKAKDLLIRGRELAEAQAWAGNPPRVAPPVTDLHHEFLAASRKQERRGRRMRVVAAAAVVSTVAGLAYFGWADQTLLKAYMQTFLDALQPKVLSQAAELALKPGATFKECANCPEMIVVPPGTFMMGAAASDSGAEADESPKHTVTIAKPFAVSKFDVTFDEWDACYALFGCDYQPGDMGWGRGRHPVVNVTWDDVQQYVKWLSRQTGKQYRLLSESEWEYSARAGSDKTYYWGDDIGRGNASCDGCGSQWDNKETAPVGSFPPNAFGLDDMLGNVFQWVQDCYHESYQGAPTDGAAFEMPCPGGTTGAGTRRVLRGGAFGEPPANLRAAHRDWFNTGVRAGGVGFRVAKTLLP